MSDETTGTAPAPEAQAATCAPQRFRKRPVEIRAMQWDGTNTDEVKRFVGPRQQRGDEVLVEADADECGFLVAGERPGVLGSDAVVFDRFHGWIPLAVGDWIVCGVKGEFYPCTDEAFTASYVLASTVADPAVCMPR